MKKKKPKTAGLHYENNYRLRGYKAIVGLDEAGRGAWAGPVTAGAVVLPVHDRDLTEKLLGVRDSKQMTPRQRGILVETIKDVALSWGVGMAGSGDIDAYGIVPATKLAMKRALDDLHTRFPDVSPDCMFLDSMNWDDCPDPYVHLFREHIRKGDQNSLSIAAASVIAKTARDAHMVELGETYPDYGFGQHKGYGTALHRAALKQHGVTPIHRAYFAPIRALHEGESA